MISVNTVAAGERVPRNKNAAEIFPKKVSAHFRSLIREEGDPIWKQCMPSPEELSDFQNVLPEDGLGEGAHSPCARLIRHYEDRALLLATNRCFTLCRFCFRKRLWKEPSFVISPEELDEVISYLKAHPEIHELLLSGGDPLTLSDDALAGILEKLSALPSIGVIRVCSRAPAFEPSRITEAFADRLGSFEKTWFVTHFNHPRELCAESLEACRKIRARGIPVLNQTVLLKGINDDPAVLAELFRTLADNRIKPHYLFHADPVRGSAHFATGLPKAMEFMAYFRKNLSSIATPVFAFDLPEGGGKVQLFPDCSAGDKRTFYSIDGRVVRHPLL